MFATVRAWQSLALTSLETMVTPTWDGEFTVNYNLDNEQVVGPLIHFSALTPAPSPRLACLARVPM